MAKSKDTFGKKEKEKKRLKERQDKHEKMEERKANAKKGKSLDEMMAYIDENGNISSTPPDPKRMKTFNVEDMQIGVPKYQAPNPEDLIRKGVVTFFNHTKGFGFIKHDDSNKETFVHVSGLIDEIKENDRVEFDVQNGKKGLNAVNVKLI